MQYCKGCLVWTQGSLILSELKNKACRGTYNKDGYCPCSQCLIKGMCREECEDYMKFKSIVLKAANAGVRVKDIIEIVKDEQGG